MFAFYFLLTVYTICICLLIWIWTIIIRLYINKHYRECPPYVPSFGAEKKVIIARVREILQKSAQPLTILDPGCGCGSLIVKLAKEFPQHHFIGVEWSKFAAAIADLKTRKLKNTQILCQDMFDYDFGQADIIVCFLMDTLMEKFGKKIAYDHKKPQIILSNTFAIPNFPLFEEIKTGKNFFFKNIYIYKLD